MFIKFSKMSSLDKDLSLKKTVITVIKLCKITVI